MNESRLDRIFGSAQSGGEQVQPPEVQAKARGSERASRETIQRGLSRLIGDDRKLIDKLTRFILEE